MDTLILILYAWHIEGKKTKTEEELLGLKCDSFIIKIQMT